MKPRRLDLRRTLGVGVVRWIEASLVHGPGDIQGQAIHLDDEFVAFVLKAYAIDQHGKRLVRRAVLSRPKGRAKSELSAMLACVEALGPVRFSHWDADGYPVGRPVTNPVVLCAATEEGQAGNVYDAVVFMLREGAVAATPGLDVGLTRTFVPGGGSIRPITAKASSKDGGRETFAIIDESHLYVSPELKRLFDTIRRNLVKRREAEPWCLETTTMYAPGEESVAEHSHRYAEAITRSGTPDPGFLFDHRQAPPMPKDASEEELRAGLVAAYGEAAGWMDLDRILLELRDPQTDPGDWRRYFLNQPTERTHGKWVSDEAWRACQAELEIPAGAPIMVGVDAAHSRDTTAVAWSWRSDDGRIVQRVRVWSAVESKPHDVFAPGGRIDNDVVRDFILGELGRDYTVRLVLGDERYFNDQLHEISEAGYSAVELKQDSSDMRDAWNEWYGHVMAGPAPRIVHDGSATFAHHVRNAVGTRTESGWKVSKRIAGATPIDAVAAAAMSAYGVVHESELAPDEAFAWGPA